MKENKYDNAEFFKKYSAMDRSTQGLEGAGEWNTLKTLLPSFQNKRVLDLGCGFGWHCEYALQQGAKHVIGCDISTKMLAIAKTKCSQETAQFICAPMEELTFDKEQFNVVLSSLALHYVEDFTSLVTNVYTWLQPGGTFVFSVEHPTFSAQGKQDWYYDEQGEIMHFPVDHYFYEGKREAIFLGEKVIKYHRTLTSYVDTLLQAGFRITRLVEPQPPTSLLHVEGMKEEMRRPMMLIIVAQKEKQ